MFLSHLLFLFYVYECFAFMCINAPYTCSALKDHKKGIGFQALELQASGHVDSGTWAQEPLQEQQMLSSAEPPSSLQI